MAEGAQQSGEEPSKEQRAAALIVQEHPKAMAPETGEPPKATNIGKEGK